MALETKLIGTAGNEAGVNTDHELAVALTADSGKAGFSVPVTEKGVDAAGNRYLYELESSTDYRLRVGMDAMLFHEYPIGTAINTSIWTYPATTMTVSLAANKYLLNNGNNAGTSTYVRLSTWRSFPIQKAFATYCEQRVMYTAIPTANTIMEWGLFNSATTAAPTDGVFFRVTQNQFRGVICNNSVESYVDLGYEGDSPIAGTPPDTNIELNCVIETTMEETIFWVNNFLAGRVATPNTQPGPVSVNQLPLASRIVNAAVAPAYANQLQVSAQSVSVADMNNTRLWATTMVGMGQGAYQVPTGAAAGQTAAYTNGTGPTTRAASATTAMETGLGGVTTFAAYAGSEVDNHLFGYLVPAGKTLYVRGVRIETANLGAAVATTATLCQYAVGVGSTANTLAGTESGTVKIRRAIPLGFASFAVGAVIGAVASPIDANFDAPLVVHAGEYFSVMVRCPVGTATASQLIRVMAMVNGFFE